MEMNNQTANIERAANTGRFSKRIGSVTYEVNVMFSAKSAETMNEKIIRLVKNEAWGKAAV